VEQEEVINLTESSNVLAIVFDFMYPRKQGDIEQMEFEVVIQVAEAVEKYQVFSAMKVCELRLKWVIRYHILRATSIHRRLLDNSSRHMRPKFLLMVSSMIIRRL